MTANRGITQICRRERHMANIQRQAEKMTKIVGHTQKHTENKITHKRAVMLMNISGQMAARLRTHDFS
jgi:hypothetical protein